MRIDLILQRLHPSLQQQALLFFELHLDAYAVPDLQLSADGDDRCGVNRDPNPRIQASWTEAFDRKDGMGQKSGNLGLHEAQSYDRKKKHDLPIEQTRSGQVAADHAIDTEIDKGRE